MSLLLQWQSKDRTYVGVFSAEKHRLIELAHRLCRIDDIVQLRQRFLVIFMLAECAVVIRLEIRPKPCDSAQHQDSIEVDVLQTLGVRSYPRDKARQVRSLRQPVSAKPVHCMAEKTYPFAGLLVKGLVAYVRRDRSVQSCDA